MTLPFLQDKTDQEIATLQEAIREAFPEGYKDKLQEWLNTYYQTQIGWHDQGMSKLEVEAKEIIQYVLGMVTLGESP